MARGQPGLISGRVNAQGRPVLSRQRLLRMQAAPAGTVAATVLLPETGAYPNVQPQPLEWSVWPPSIHSLRLCNCVASFCYKDPKGQIGDTTTLMGIRVGSSGSMRFETLAGWEDNIGLTRVGDGKTGTIYFPVNSLGLCDVGETRYLCVQLRVRVDDTSMRRSCTLRAYVLPGSR